MPVTSHMLTELSTLGLSGDQLAGVLRILAVQQAGEEARETKREEIRRKDRERKRNSSGTATEDQPETTEKEIPPTPPKENTTPLEPTRARARGTRIPDDFRPLPNIREMTLNRGLSPAEFDDQLERFIDWAKSKSGQDGYKLDWQAACRNWMKRAADDKRKSSKHSGRSTPGQELRDAFADQRAYFDSQGHS
jgi:hypothetical protein